jgi:hypothetical protein
LRYMGVPCAHGAITDTVRAFALLARSTVIANFASAYTPTGSPRKLSELNRQIVASVFANAPRDATRSDVLDMGGLGDSRPPFPVPESPSLLSDCGGLARLSLISGLS